MSCTTRISIGVILSIMFINDLPKQIKCSYSIFADDTKQKDLDALQERATTWILRFNPTKCHALHIGKVNKRYLYHLNNYVLLDVMSEKDLRVIIRNDLKMKDNVTPQVKKATKMLGMIKRAFKYLNKANSLLVLIVG